MSYPNPQKLAELRALPPGPAAKRLRDEIFTSNYGLVKVAAIRYRERSKLPLSELEQAASIGMLRAIDSYEPAKGGLANWSIRWMLREMQDLDRAYDPSIRQGGKNAKRRARARAGESAEDLGVSPEVHASWVTDIHTSTYQEPWESRDIHAGLPGLSKALLDLQGPSPETLADRERTLERVLVACRALTAAQQRAIARFIEADEPSSVASNAMEGIRRALTP